MQHRIQTVTAKENYFVEVVFFGGEVKQYDVKRLFQGFPQFQLFLNAKDLFHEVMVDTGGYGISWNDELDLDAETIWNDGVFIEYDKKTDINCLLAYRLSIAREAAHMTQKELSEMTGIYQADISKIERGIGNPSLATLERLAEGLNMKLDICFIGKDEPSSLLPQKVRKEDAYK